MSFGDLGWLVLGVLLWTWDLFVPKTVEAWVGLIGGFTVVAVWLDLLRKLEKMSERIAALDGRVRDLTAAIRGKADDDYEKDDD